jgi:hypothetical protein
MLRFKMVQIFPTSGVLKQDAGAAKGKGGRKRVWPWHLLEIGQSFPIPSDRMTFGTAKSLAYKTGKRLNKKFHVFNHGDTYEVGRIE